MPEYCKGSGVIAGVEQLFALSDKAREQHGVDVALVHAKQISGRTRNDLVRTQRFPKRVHMHLERTLGSRGRRLSPHGVDQLIQRDDLVEVEREARQHSACLPPAQCERLPVVAYHFERAEDAQLHL